nr:copper transporter 5.1-like [Ipomoea batatas]
MMEFIFFFVAMESSNPNEQTQGHDAREYELDKLEAGELKYYGDTTKELNEVPAAHYLLDNHIEVDFNLFNSRRPAVTKPTGYPSPLSDFSSEHIRSAKMMHMTFYWGKNVTLLFDFWKTDSWTSYTLTLLACLIFAVFYQYMEERRQRFKLISSLSAKKGVPPPSQSQASPIDAPLLYSLPSVGGWRYAARFAGAVLFGVNSAIGYMLMLAIMSFNAGVLIAVVVGLSVGYLLFRSGGEEDVVVVDNPCACA